MLTTLPLVLESLDFEGVCTLKELLKAQRADLDPESNGHKHLSECLGIVTANIKRREAWS